MTDKLRAAAVEALEELENHSGNYKLSKAEGVQHTAVVDALRQALAEWTPDDTAYRPHIVMLRGTSTMKCLHCHQSYNINMPCPAPLFTAITGKFIEAHKDCEARND